MRVYAVIVNWRWLQCSVQCVLCAILGMARGAIHGVGIWHVVHAGYMACGAYWVYGMWCILGMWCSTGHGTLCNNKHSVCIQHVSVLCNGMAHSL